MGVRIPRKAGCSVLRATGAGIRLARAQCPRGLRQPHVGASKIGHLQLALREPPAGRGRGDAVAGVARFDLVTVPAYQGSQGSRSAAWPVRAGCNPGHGHPLVFFPFGTLTVPPRRRASRPGQDVCWQPPREQSSRLKDPAGRSAHLQVTEAAVARVRVFFGCLDVAGGALSLAPIINGNFRRSRRRCRRDSDGGVTNLMPVAAGRHRRFGWGAEKLFASAPMGNRESAGAETLQGQPVWFAETM